MPDEKSIMTYLIGYYNKFAKMEQDDVWRRRLHNAMQLHVEVGLSNHFVLGSPSIPSSSNQPTNQPTNPHLPHSWKKKKLILKSTPAIWSSGCNRPLPG